MYVQYNIVHAWFEVQSKLINTWKKEYVFWIWSSIDVKSFVYFCRPILPLLPHLSLSLSLFLLLLLHTSCWGSQMRDHSECAVILCSTRKVINELHSVLVRLLSWRHAVETVAVCVHVFHPCLKKNSAPYLKIQRWNSQTVEINVNASHVLLRNWGPVRVVTTGWEGSTPLLPTDFLPHPISTFGHTQSWMCSESQSLCQYTCTQKCERGCW